MRIAFFIASALAAASKVSLGQVRTSKARCPHGLRDGFIFLDNGIVRLGIDTSRGGAIGYLSSSSSTQNLLNHHDFGRLVQGSFYSGPSPFDTPEKQCDGSSWDPWPWNPIGGGDAFNHSSVLLNVTVSNDKTSAIIVSRPYQWACNNVPCECTFTQAVSLVDSAVEVTLTLNNARTDIPTSALYSMTQELPAVYIIGEYCHLFLVNSSSPYTGSTPVEVPATWPWSSYKPSEGWMAFANSSDPASAFAVGVWGPGHYHTGAGRYFSSPPVQCGGQEGDDPTGYIAPWIPEILDRDIVYGYNFSLVVGKLADIQSYAASKARAGFSQPQVPDYTFGADTGRAHFTYSGGLVDGGWPVTDAGLAFSVAAPYDPTQALLAGPFASWMAADVPTLAINGSWPAGVGGMGVAWEYWTDAVPCPTCLMAVPVPPTAPPGQYQLLQVDLSSSPAYTGRIGRIALRPALNAVPGETVYIKSVKHTQ